MKATTDIRKSGMSVVGIIVLIVVIVAIGVGVVYFTSDVYRTKIDASANQYAHWTPENIAKDPENYLNFCETQANQAVTDLKASKISIAQNRASLTGRMEDAGSKITIGVKTLTELKDLYPKTEAANAWPVEWQGQSRDKDWMKRQIVSLNRQIEGQKTIKIKVQEAIKQLDVQTTRVQTAETQNQEQIAEIKTSREILKVQKITKDLTDRLISIKSALQSTISVAGDASSVVSLDQIAASAATVADDGEFDKIMSMK